MTSVAVAVVALAVAAAFLHPAVIAVVDELRERRKRLERQAAEKELKDACASGNAARIVVARLRMRELKD